jgi:hypothetical protein
MPSHFTWDDVEFSPSLSEGTQAPTVVALPLVENVRVLRGCVLFTCREGDKPCNLDLKSLGV